MASPLVATKLFVPTRRTGLVARPRLRERLDRGAKARLTLVSAPAGFGKTTLIAEWLANASKRASAWLSLDRTDNDPGTFWSDVIAALQTAAPGVGATMLLIGLLLGAAAVTGVTTPLHDRLIRRRLGTAAG